MIPEALSPQWDQESDSRGLHSQGFHSGRTVSRVSR